MSKTVIPFIDSNKWETKEDCLFCQTIDRMFKTIHLLPTYEEQQQQLSKLDDTLLVNGYGLIKVLEGRGEIIIHPNDISRISLYYDNSEKFMKKVHNVLYSENRVDISNIIAIDEPVLIHSRWCKSCSRRKPDIFDSLRNSNYNILPITNLFSEIEEEGVRISWLDTAAEIWDYTELRRSNNSNMENSELVIKYGLIEGRNYYSKQGILDKQAEEGQIYFYQVLNYDVTNTLIQKSDILEVYNTTEDITPPQPILDFVVQQVREIDEIDLIARDYIVMRWTDPSDKDYDGTMIRMGDIELTPQTEKDGKEVSSRYLIRLPNEVDATYYLKPFPYDKIKYKPNTSGIGYYQYRNFNRESIPTYIKIKPQISNVSNIKHSISDKEASIQWTDPQEEDWKGTLIMYKKGGIILNKDDGIFLTITDIKNCFEEGKNSLIIPNLENNVEYYIGMFPISKDGLCNVSPENQIKIITGYYKDDLFIDFNDISWKQKLTYCGKFNVVEDKVIKSNVLMNPIVDVDERIICFTEATDFKYGGTLSFDYTSDIIPEFDNCTFYINGEKLLHLTGKNNWKHFSYEIPSIDYIKLTIEWIRTYPYDTNSWVKINNIKMTYNSHI